MPVKIRVVGPDDNHEHQYALELKAIFEKGLPDSAAGDVCIVNSVQLFGQSTRDIDIVVFGALDGGVFEVVTKTRESPSASRKRRIRLKSFCFTVEVKEHDAHAVEMRGTSVLVKYGNGKVRDATAQSEDQKYSLLNYIRAIIPETGAWICNFLWMRNLSMSSVASMTKGRPHNILPATFSLPLLVELACLQSPPVEGRNGDCCHISSLYKRPHGTARNAFQALESLFTVSRQPPGRMTRMNVERIVGEKLELPDELVAAIGKRLVVVSGRAGTGKTVKMLNIGCQLASSGAKRCLFLTYNRALVNDIRRTLYFANVPTDFDDGCVEIMTVHEFVRKLGIALGVVTSTDYSPGDHLQLCSQISDYIDAEAITNDDIIALMRERQELACWDHVFVDEAQDFAEQEKALLFSFFGYRKLIIADGVDQFVRGSKASWSKNIYMTKCTEKRCLRQKRNIATFVNDYANAMQLKWHLDILPELLGGKVIVSDRLLPFEVFRENRERCYEQGNKAFEMLFLTPPDFVQKSDGRKYFSLLPEFSEQGFSLWDGTRTDMDARYLSPIAEHRLLQYESCRGLEGWCVVCLGFDRLIEHRAAVFAREDEDLASRFGLVAMDSDEAKRQFVALWSLIPLTRAIDTLIITLSDTENWIRDLLRQCSQADYVELIS